MRINQLYSLPSIHFSQFLSRISLQPVTVRRFMMTMTESPCLYRRNSFADRLDAWEACDNMKTYEYQNDEYIKLDGRYWLRNHYCDSSVIIYLYLNAFILRSLQVSMTCMFIKKNPYKYDKYPYQITSYKSNILPKDKNIIAFGELRRGSDCKGRNSLYAECTRIDHIPERNEMFRKLYAPAN
ncbi:hypothetical protein QTP88_014558 [Uroleucon formosanum]